MNYTLSVGFNGDTELLKRMMSEENKIGTLYTGGYLKNVSSGRYQHNDSREGLEELVKQVHSYGVRIAITLNSPCNVPPLSDKIWWKRMEDYLKELEGIGVDTVIIAHPFVMNLAKEKTNMCVATSIVCDVDTPRGALYYENMGADIIVPSASINYEIDMLREIKKNLKTAKLAIIANEACLGNCPWRRFHQNALSHADKPGYDVDYAMSCSGLYLSNPHMTLTNNVIRPEDLNHYEGITDMFKLVGRTTDDDTLCNMISAYSKAKYVGNLMEIIDKGFSKKINLPNNKLNDLFDHKQKCKKNCQNCTWCKSLYESIN